MLRADFPQALEIALRRYDDAGRTLHRLDDDGRDGRGIVQRDDALEILRQVQAPVGLALAERHLRRIPGMRQVIDAGYHQRREHLAIGDDAADRDATQANAVITAFPADDAGPCRVTAQAMVGDGNLERRVDGLRARIHEEHAVVRTTRQGSDARGERKRGRMAHLEAGREVERFDLGLHGLDDGRVRVAERRTPEARQAVEHAAAVGELVVGTLRLGDQPRLGLEVAVVREGHPPVAQVEVLGVGVQVGDGVHGRSADDG